MATEQRWQTRVSLDSGEIGQIGVGLRCGYGWAFQGDTLSDGEVGLPLGVYRYFPCWRQPPLLVAVPDMTGWLTVASLLVSAATTGGSLWYNGGFVCLGWIGL
ncbi:hypothetical protein Dimus_015410 [Dionaea muscipula]